jgi:hypothetical protein
MKGQKGRAVLLVTVLLTSVALLAWSVLSTWQQSKKGPMIETSAAITETSSALPPPLDSKAAKAKLFYPVMKARGPQPGGGLQSKPLVGAMPAQKEDLQPEVK